MTEPFISAQEQMRHFVSKTIAPLLKAAGFRRSGVNFSRRCGEAVQVINLQSSMGSTALEKRFYVNVGIAFDDLCKLTGVAVKEAPKEAECDKRGLRARLEQLTSEIPDCWTLRADGDNSPTSEGLSRALQTVCVELDQIDGLRAYRSHVWFDRERPSEQSVQILYLLGEMKEAQAELCRLAARFSDRQSGGDKRAWAELLGLPKLACES